MASRNTQEKTSGQVFPITIVAALKQELAPLQRRPHLDLHFIRTGMGCENAHRVLRARLKQRPVRAVIGIGFAGALSPSLQVGDLIVARRIRGVSDGASSPEWLSVAERVPPDGLVVHFGTTITVNDIIGEAAAKRSLAQALATDEVGCVDMESSAIARICIEHHIAFLIVRCITDTLDENLPLDFNKCRHAHGDLSLMKVMKAVLGRPRAIRGLRQLQRRSRFCAEQLARFVERLLLAQTEASTP